MTTQVSPTSSSPLPSSLTSSGGDRDSWTPKASTRAHRKPGPKARQLAADWQRDMDVFERHLRARGMSEESIRTRLAHIRTLALSVHMGPGEMTQEQLLEWAGDRKWQRETRHSYYNSFVAFFALIRGEDSPAASLPRTRRPVGAPRPVPEAQFTRALQTTDLRTRAVLVLAGQAGLRRAEIAQVRLDDLSLDGQNWYLEVHGKGGKSRSIPVAEHVASMIRDQCERHGSPWLFPSPATGSHLTPGHISKIAAKSLPPEPQPTTRRSLVEFAAHVRATDRSLNGGRLR